MVFFCLHFSNGGTEEWTLSENKWALVQKNGPLYRNENFSFVNENSCAFMRTFSASMRTHFVSMRTSPTLTRTYAALMRSPSARMRTFPIMQEFLLAKSPTFNEITPIPATSSIIDEFSYSRFFSGTSQSINRQFL